MKRRFFRWLGTAALLLAVAGIAAPFLHADRYRDRIQSALSTALGRSVTIDGSVTLNLFTGPGLSIGDVKIAGGSGASSEPFAYVEEVRATPRLWSFWTHRLEFSSLTLEGAHVNLARTGSVEAPSWNFETLLSPGLLSTFPNIHMRDSRINFIVNGRKQNFYLLNTDLDISPRSSDGSDWQLRFVGEPARTDRPARGSGSFRASGRWRKGSLELDVSLERSEIGAVIALVKGSGAGIQGLISGQVHVSGPTSNLGVEGEVRVSELHGWDESPPSGGVFDFRVSGTANPQAQHIELFAEPKTKLAVVKAHLVADGYLQKSTTLFEVHSDAFPIASLPGLFHNFGAPIPDGLRVAGSMKGDIRYATGEGWTGAATIEDAGLHLEGVPDLRFEQASFRMDRDSAQVGPVNILSGATPVGSVSAGYSLDSGSFQVDLTSDGGPLAALLQQFPSAAVPLLSGLQSGNWSGELKYAQGAWTGEGTLTAAVAAVPALAQPVKISTAHVRLDGPAIQLDHMRLSAGGVQAEGDYRFVPDAPRPHQFRLTATTLDAAVAEAILRPVLRHAGNLFDLAMSLGRTRIPDWLRGMHAEGTFQADSLVLAGSTLSRLRSHLQWDGTEVVFPDIQARLPQGTIAGHASVNLHEIEPHYSALTKVHGLEWQNGSVDGTLHLETSGTGLDTLSNLKLDGIFAASGIEGTPLGTLDKAAGVYALSWSGATPKFRLAELRVVNADGEIWTGTGASQGAAGEVLLQLSNKGKQISLAGSLTDPAKNWVQQ